MKFKCSICEVDLPQRCINSWHHCMTILKNTTTSGKLTELPVQICNGLDNILPEWLIFILQDPIFSLQSLHRSNQGLTIQPWSEITSASVWRPKPTGKQRPSNRKNIPGPRDNRSSSLGANRFTILIFYFWLITCIIKNFNLLVWY